MLPFVSARLLRQGMRASGIVLFVLSVAHRAAAQEPLFPIQSPDVPAAQQAATYDLKLLADVPLAGPWQQGGAEFIREPGTGKPCFVVKDRQAGTQIEKPAFLTAGSMVRWAWKKDQGKVCIIQFELVHPQTRQRRYLGYAAGELTEPPSADPTVEYFVAKDLPRQWTALERNLYDDMHRVLGWESAQLVGFFLSPWDGQPGLFADLTVHGVAPADVQEQTKQAELAALSRIGKGRYVPLRIKRADEKRVDRFDSSFEECAPGRNSAANEWSAFGAIGNMDFNAMGRELWVRYPAFELAFRIADGEGEIEPGRLESFRLGLVRNRLPAIWGGWQHGGLLYKVSVMTVPSPQCGNFDLYKLEVQNRTAEPLSSRLFVGVDGPPDIRLEDGVVRALGDAPMLIADAPTGQRRVLRRWGWCDKRAKGYATGGGPGKTEPAIASYRLGLDGLPVVYRFRAEQGKKYTVVLVSTPHIGGHYVEKPQKPGDLVYEYRVEGCAPQTLDYMAWIAKNHRPLCAVLEGAHDADGDGAVEVMAGVAGASRIRHTRLSAIYVFPAGTPVDDLEGVYRGAMNGKCVCHIDVGATPEQGPANQEYDRSDASFARLRLDFGEVVPPGQTKTRWLRVPPIHRREPVSMGYIAHAFRDILPGEAVPPFGAEQVKALKEHDPQAAERQVVDFWEGFFKRAAKFEVPDAVLNDIYLSRLATRAILDVNLNAELCFNPCSPFFYFDHAYRDQAYVVYALDLAGLHDRAERLLRVYCRDAKDVPPGPIAFDGKPLQLGMLPNGLWNTRPGQWDTQGQNIWALVQHYKLSGDRGWLEQTAYPYIRRGAQWIINSRHKHKAEVKDPNDPRYGLLEPGAMEVMEVGKGMHMYYLNGFAILGLREAADAAAALGRDEDVRLLTTECLDLKKCLHRSFTQTFKRTGLYEGHLFFGVEPEGVGMYGFWAHNCLLWPCRCIDPHDPMLAGTLRRMERMSNEWGGGMHSEGPGGFWPYIGVDRAVGSLLRGEPERTLEYFCAFTDTAGGTLSWGEGYANLLAGGDQPHFWADAQWVNLFRQLFAFEDGNSLWITPALFRRWHEGNNRVAVSGLPTHFGDLDLNIQPSPDGSTVNYRLRLSPKGDQASRKLDRIVLYPRVAGGRGIHRVMVDGKEIPEFTRDAVILANPKRAADIQILVEAGPW